MFGIGPQYYSHIYIWLVTILSLVIFSRYSYYPQGRLDIARTGRQFGVDILSLFLVFFIGLRPAIHFEAAFIGLRDLQQLGLNVIGC